MIAKVIGTSYVISEKNTGFEKNRFETLIARFVVTVSNVTQFDVPSFTNHIFRNYKNPSKRKEVSHKKRLVTCVFRKV